MNLVRTIVQMGTLVTIEVVGRSGASGDDDGSDLCREAVERACEWFRRVEACCSRFDPESELRRLSATTGVAVPVSPMLFEAVQFATAVAAESGGAFDPTVGAVLETRGFDRHYQTGLAAPSGNPIDGQASYRDISFDADAGTITLERPLTLDLGGVAKGLAVDMAARELGPLNDFAIDAGGDLFLAGCNAAGEPWSVGIRHPREEGQLLDVLRVSGKAVCTSGDYERRDASGLGHHLLEPRQRVAAARAASVTVIGGTAMVADAVATAAFVLGPVEGIAFCERTGVEALIVSPALERFETAGFRHA